MIEKLGTGDIRTDWLKVNEIIDCLNSLGSLPVHVNTPAYNFYIATPTLDGSGAPTGTYKQDVIQLHCAPTTGRFINSDGKLTLELS